MVLYWAGFCRFCGAPDGDGHLYWECTFPPLVEIRENPEFHELRREDKAQWRRCLLWHGWLPMLSGVNGASSWAVDASESAAYLVEVALGRYSSGLVTEWSPSDEFDEARAASSLPDYPTARADGSLVLDPVTGVSSSGSGFFAHQSEHCWSGRRWGHVDGIRVDHDASYCRVSALFLGLFNLFRGLRCGGSFWLCSPLVRFTLVLIILVLFGMLGACWMVAVVLPFELVNDGDLLLLIERMLHLRGLDTVRVSKVKGHADEDMVLHGRVRREHKLGNYAADEAAEFGRRRVSPVVIDARRNLSGVCSRWYSVILTFIISSLLFLVLWSIMMVLVVLLLILLFGLLVLFLRGVGWFMRFGIGLSCPDHLIFGILSGFRFQLLLSVLRILHFGLTLLVFWLSGSLS